MTEKDWDSCGVGDGLKVVMTKLDDVHTLVTEQRVGRGRQRDQTVTESEVTV
mgnify:CR=1 FL=1